MSDKSDALPEHVTDNIERMAQLRSDEARRMSRHQRAVERAASSIGRPASLYVLVAIALVWVAWNGLATVAGWPRFDAPPFFWLQGAVSLYAAFVATMVLAAQNQQRVTWEQRAHLELQVNLLSEQKVTKIIALLEELRRDLPMVINRTDALADAMQKHVDPQAVLSKLEDAMDGSELIMREPE